MLSLLTCHGSEHRYLEHQLGAHAHRLVRRVVDELKPDILCLQETKTPDELFPREPFEAIGFAHMHVHGMKGYNGVAILSKLPLDKPRNEGWCERTDCRHIIAELPGGIELHNVYVPAGGDIPDPEDNPKFAISCASSMRSTGWFKTTAPATSR